MKRFFASDFFYDFVRSPVALVSFLIVLFLILSAVFAGVIAPTNPFDAASLNLMNGFTPPMEPNLFTGDVFWMGTDDQGRDLFSAILYGLRISLFVGAMAVALATVMGVLLGLIAGYMGGWLDNLIMRFADIQMTFPSILIAMLIFGVARGILPPELRDEMAITVLIVSIGLSEWVPFARTVRGSTLVEKEKEYIAAARLIGLNRWQIMIRHILPNVLSTLVTFMPFTVVSAISAITALDFLGFGLPVPTPSLGELLKQGTANLRTAPWIVTAAFGTLVLILTLVTFIGEAIRESFDPKQFTLYR